MLAIHAFSSLLWLWDAQAKHGFASCGVHALLPLLPLLMLEMHTLLPRDGQGHRSIPPAYTLSLGKGGLPSPRCIYPPFSPPSAPLPLRACPQQRWGEGMRMWWG